MYNRLSTPLLYVELLYLQKKKLELFSLATNLHHDLCPLHAEMRIFFRKLSKCLQFPLALARRKELCQNIFQKIKLNEWDCMSRKERRFFD